MPTTNRARRWLAGLIPELPGPAWTLVSVHGLANLAGGILWAFLVVYLHFVRDISLGVSGVALATVPLAAMIVGPVAGTLADRISPRLVIAGGGALAASGAAALGGVTAAWQAIVVALVLGAGFTCMESPTYTLLAVAVPKERRSAIFALDYAMLAAGWGSGGFIGGLLVDIHHADTFQAAFLLAAALYLVFAAVVLRVAPRAAAASGAPPAGAPDPHAGFRGYRIVLADRSMRRIVAVSVVLLAASYSQFDVTFPAVAIGDAHVGTKVIGLAFLANMLTIVLGQLVILRLLEGRRRTRAMILMCCFSGACWLAVLFAAHIGGGLPAALALIVAFVIVAFAEMTWSPSVPGMVNDLAPAELRGRYNATDAFAESGGRLIGPVIGGFALGAGFTDAWLVAIVVVSLASVAIVVDLERVVPDSANRVGPGGHEFETGSPPPTVL